MTLKWSVVKGLSHDIMREPMGCDTYSYDRVAEGTNGNMTAPISSCLPILLPGGAVIPAMKAATGLGSPYK